MTQDINLGGTIYISSKRATEITGYSQDYIGQLARAGKIDAQRVAGLWYVLEESLLRHKHKADEFVPTPPTRVVAAEAEASVSFDGRDYISASRAAKITGYSQDYVGQLARGEKIPSRQIGARWYVDRTAIIEHKRHNDSLLGAVQAESVGIRRAAPESPEIDSRASQHPEQHFSYIEESLPQMPDYEVKEENASKEEEEAYSGQSIDELLAAPASENQIAIRVIEPASEVGGVEEITMRPRNKSATNRTRIAMYSLAFLGLISVAGVAFTQRSYIAPQGGGSVLASVNSSAIDVLESVASATVQTAGGIAKMSSQLFSKEIVYQRQNR